MSERVRRIERLVEELLAEVEGLKKELRVEELFRLARRFEGVSFVSKKVRGCGPYWYARSGDVWVYLGRDSGWDGMLSKVRELKRSKRAIEKLDSAVKSLRWDVDRLVEAVGELDLDPGIVDELRPLTERLEGKLERLRGWW